MPINVLKITDFPENFHLGLEALGEGHCPMCGVDLKVPEGTPQTTPDVPYDVQGECPCCQITYRAHMREDDETTTLAVNMTQQVRGRDAEGRTLATQCKHMTNPDGSYRI